MPAISTIHHQRKLPNFAPVLAGSTATTKVASQGPSYRGFVLKYTPNGVAANEATMKADIERVRLKVEGIVRWEATGAQIIDILTKYRGNSFEDGLLFIDLARHDLATIAGQENTVWGTADVEQFHIEVDIAPGATNPQLVGFATVDPVKMPLGTIIECHSTQFNSATSGPFEIDNLTNSRGLLFALHCQSSNISGMEVHINGYEYQNTDLDVLEAIYRRFPSGRVPQTGYRHYDPTYLDRLDDVLTMNATDWRLKLELSAASSVPIFMETFNQPHTRG